MVDIVQQWYFVVGAVQQELEAFKSGTNEAKKFGMR
jgi:hypothetical protein